MVTPSLFIPEQVAQSVTCLKAAMCLTADTCQTGDQEFASSIPAQSYTFTEIDHEIIVTDIIFPSADFSRVVVSYIRKYVHRVLINSQACPGKKCGKVN